MRSRRCHSADPPRFLFQLMRNLVRRANLLTVFGNARLRTAGQGVIPLIVVIERPGLRDSEDHLDCMCICTQGHLRDGRVADTSEIIDCRVERFHIECQPCVRLLRFRCAHLSGTEVEALSGMVP